MKHTWEAKDIVGGQWAAPVDSDAKFTQCVTWHSNRGNHPRVSKTDNVYGICDLATDGLSLDLGTKADVADYFNKHGYVPIDKAQIIRTPNGPQPPRT